MLRQKAECFFWYRPTRVVLEQRPLNGCCCCTIDVFTMQCYSSTAINYSYLLSDMSAHEYVSYLCQCTGVESSVSPGTDADKSQVVDNPPPVSHLHLSVVTVLAVTQRLAVQVLPLTLKSVLLFHSNHHTPSPNSNNDPRQFSANIYSTPAKDS